MGVVLLVMEQLPVVLLEGRSFVALSHGWERKRVLERYHQHLAAADYFEVAAVVAAFSLAALLVETAAAGSVIGSDSVADSDFASAASEVVFSPPASASR